MISSPQILRTDALLAAVIHIVTPRAEMLKVFEPAVGELMATLSAQGLEPAGAIFVHHMRMAPGVFDFELGVPVLKTVRESGRVKPGLLPAVKVARTVYSGAYDGLPAAWGAFSAWVKANGYQPEEDLWEHYLVGPQSTPDPNGWRTELNQPLRT